LAVDDDTRMVAVVGIEIDDVKNFFDRPSVRFFCRLSFLDIFYNLLRLLQRKKEERTLHSFHLNEGSSTRETINKVVRRLQWL
jgi:hypothetical protein